MRILVILRGFYMTAFAEPRAYRCATARACRGGPNAFSNRTCEEGYSGLLCGRCIEQYYRGLRRCLPCASATDDSHAGDLGTVVMLPLLSVIAIVAAVAYLRQPSLGLGELQCTRRLSRMRTAFFRTQLGRRLPEYLTIINGLAKISLGYTQCLGALDRFPLVAWPDAFLVFVEVLDDFTTHPSLACKCSPRRAPVVLGRCSTTSTSSCSPSSRPSASRAHGLDSG